MSKVTATRLARTFVKLSAHDEKDEITGVITRVPEQIFKRNTKLDPQPRAERPCRFCHKPMMVSAGQIAYFHKECRHKKRNQRGQGKKGR